jgi:hypothetical protein
MSTEGTAGLTGANTIAVHNAQNPGTIMGKDVLLLLMTPTARWALKIHASETPRRTTIQSDTLARVEGVRVASI